MALEEFGREQEPQLLGGAGTTPLVKTANVPTVNIPDLADLWTRGGVTPERGPGPGPSPGLALPDSKVPTVPSSGQHKISYAVMGALGRVEEAEKKEKENPGDAKTAWCALAKIEESNPYRAQAQSSCKKWGHYVDELAKQKRRMAKDWSELKKAMGMLSDKRARQKLGATFRGQYGTLMDGALRADLSALETHGGGGQGMVHIAGGRFDGHRIPAFLMDRTEVTVAAYRKCVKAGKCKKPDTGTYSNYYERGRDQHPVNEVSALDADAYCAWAGKRLPTEWEWEWAARGRDEGEGKGRTYPWGKTKPSCDLAVMDDGGSGCGNNSTMEVGSKSPAGDSRDGLQDMAGNVWEWTSSTEGDKRVLRGGGWFDVVPRTLAASYRRGYAPSARSSGCGFRCARPAE